MLARLSVVAFVLSAPSLAGDVRLEVTGTVVGVVGTMPAPLDAAAVGQPFEAAFELIDEPDMVSPSFYQYPADLLQGFVRVGTAQTELETISSGQLNLQDGVIDGITVGGPVNAGFVTGISLGYIDITGSVLNGPDMNALVGQTINISQNGVGVIMNTFVGAQIDLEITQMRFLPGTCPRIGDNYCDAEDNSIGREGATAACGSLAVGANDVTLWAYDLPENSFGFFLVSRAMGNIPNPGGSQGTLCLGGMIGRYVGPGQIQNSGTNKRFSLPIDLTQIPTPNGPVVAAPGDVFHFTAWYRDVVGGSATSTGR